MRNRDDVATRQKLPHPRKSQDVFIDHLLKQRGRQPQHTDPLLLDHPFQSRQIDRAVRCVGVEDSASLQSALEKIQQSRAETAEA